MEFGIFLVIQVCSKSQLPISSHKDVFEPIRVQLAPMKELLECQYGDLELLSTMEWFFRGEAVLSLLAFV